MHVRVLRLIGAADEEAPGKGMMDEDELFPVLTGGLAVPLPSSFKAIFRRCGFRLWDLDRTGREGVGGSCGCDFIYVSYSLHFLSFIKIGILTHHIFLLRFLFSYFPIFYEYKRVSFY